MKFIVTDVHRRKMAAAVHSSGKIAKVAAIALGTGGMSGEEVREPSGSASGLAREVVRKAYTSATKVNDYCYEYALELLENEQVGAKISEAMLVDTDGDPICILCFRTKTKDDIRETYRIRNYYG